MVRPKTPCPQSSSSAAERLAGGGDGAQARGCGDAGLAHELEGGGRIEDVAHAEPGGEGHRRLGVELRHAVGDDRHAEIEAGQEHVGEAAHPGPVGRGPEAVAGLSEKAVGELDAGKMAQEHAMGVQGALGRAGGAGGVADEGGIIGAGRHDRAAVGGLAEFLPEAVHAGLAGIDRPDGGEVRQPVADRQHLGQVGAVGDQGLRAGIAQAEFEAVLAEEREERDHDGAEAVGGEMGERGFGSLGQQHRDPVAAGDAVAGERVGEAARGAGELAVAVVALGAVGAQIAQGQPVGLCAGPGVAAGLGDVEAPAAGPAEARAQGVPAFGRCHQGGAGWLHRVPRRILRIAPAGRR